MRGECDNRELSRFFMSGLFKRPEEKPKVLSLVSRPSSVQPSSPRIFQEILADCCGDYFAVRARRFPSDSLSPAISYFAPRVTLNLEVKFTIESLVGKRVCLLCVRRNVTRENQHKNLTNSGTVFRPVCGTPVCPSSTSYSEHRHRALCVSSRSKR